MNNNVISQRFMLVQISWQNLVKTLHIFHKMICKSNIFLPAAGLFPCYAQNFWWIYFVLPIQTLTCFDKQVRTLKQLQNIFPKLKIKNIKTFLYSLRLYLAFKQVQAFNIWLPSRCLRHLEPLALFLGIKLVIHCFWPILPAYSQVIPDIVLLSQPCLMHQVLT